MATDIFDSNVHVKGQLSCKTFVAPVGSIGDQAIESNAGIDTEKVIHRHALRYNQAPGTAVVAATADLHILQADGETLSLEAAITGAIATGGDRTVTIDLLRSTGAGAFATVLSAPIVLDNTSVLRTPESATIATPTLVDGDILRLTVAVAGAAGNQAEGLVVTLTINEDPQ